MFYPGLHQPSDAKHFHRALLSVNRLRDRVTPLPGIEELIIDSGAFTEITTHGRYRSTPAEYAAELRRWSPEGGPGSIMAARGCRVLAAVAQDYMCEPFVLGITGLTVADHQRLTIERYDALLACDTGGIPIMPVLQGYRPAEYVEHIRQYGARLTPGMWVGVGSVCKRNGNAASIEAVLLAIHRERPDLRLHGFGIKTTALGSGLVRDLLYSADSNAWSYAARKQGRNANDWREAVRFAERIETMPVQEVMPL